MICSRYSRYSKSLIKLRRFSSNANVIDKARETLKNLGGGSVDLSINNESGIAFVTLNNEEKKNALSGKSIKLIFILAFIKFY